MSITVYQNLLSALKKANKLAKQKMAEKNGFKTVEDFTTFLNNQLKPTEPVAAPAKKVTGKKSGPKVSTPKGKKEMFVINNVHILDESGSMMGPKFENALAGINNEINSLKLNTTVNYTVTIVGFSNSGRDKVYYFKTPISKVAPIKSQTRDMTALNDCVGNTLSRLLKENKVGEKTIVTIFTDGQENASREWTAAKVAQVIKDCESKGFTITFMGTEGDTKNAINLFKVDVSNTLVHQNTAESIKMSYSARGASLDSYAEDVKKGKDVSKGFFKKMGTLK